MFMHAGPVCFLAGLYAQLLTDVVAFAFSLHLSFRLMAAKPVKQ